jgi:hypothetical protein
MITLSLTITKPVRLTLLGMPLDGFTSLPVGVEATSVVSA